MSIVQIFREQSALDNDYIETMRVEWFVPRQRISIKNVYVEDAKVYVQNILKTGLQKTVKIQNTKMLDGDIKIKFVFGHSQKLLLFFIKKRVKIDKNPKKSLEKSC